MESTLSRLNEIVAEYESALVAFSGGVDSALVAVVANRVLGKERCRVGIGVSPSLARLQHDQASHLADLFGFELLEMATAEIEDPRYAANPTNRCYFCKHELWDRFTQAAEQLGVRAVFDGTNADDGGEHRPGTAAGNEFSVVSPLALAGLGKSDVRAAARQLGIPIWDAPSAPCLASRIRYGVEVSEERLSQVERGEDVLREIGVTGDFRVRHLGSDARLEVRPGEFETVRGHSAEIARAFREIGFERVALDLKGYRRGSQLETEDPPTELLEPEYSTG